MILNFFTFRSSSAGTVTVQIKTNKSTKGGLVQRSASVSSDLSRKKSEEKCSTLPRRGSKDNNFVHRGISSVEEDITIYKLPGEKLGLGLRFDGGARANEYVNRLFVQCCSKGSPSARTRYVIYLCTMPFWIPEKLNSSSLLKTNNCFVFSHAPSLCFFNNFIGYRLPSALKLGLEIGPIS